jgi:GntR family transcriptional regulator
MTTRLRDRRPLPLVLGDELRALVREELQAGAQLPTESEISTRYQVGRSTVREALKTLEQDGLIEVRHGRGRFVARTPILETPLTRLESVTEMMERLGYAISNRVLGVGTGQATADEAEALLLEQDREVLRLERVRLQGRDPLIWSIDVLPRSAIPDPIESVDWTGSLLALLEQRGRYVTTATVRIESTSLPPDVAERIGVAPGEPWLLMIQRASDGSGSPVIHSHDYHRGSKFKFHALRRRGG